ncbi:MAG: O-methyltransferase [bacterium]|nr:MAG: O-methyltransferase [bacterium]
MIKNQIWLTKSYLTYLAKAKTRYKIHSPFVFDLVENVLKDKTEYPEYRKIETYKKNISKSKTIIETVDFGTRSENKHYTTSMEKVGNIVKRRSQHKNQARLLYRLSRHFQPGNMLEFGTAAGISTAYIKAPVPESKIITMEGCASLANVAAGNLKKLGVKNVNISIGNFDVVLPKVLKKFDRLDFVFFDGNHRRKPTLDYFNRCAELAHEDAIFIFDDIHWSPGMADAWNIIKKDERVSISLDVFWLGLVFFRKGITKQDFIIRY